MRQLFSLSLLLSFSFLRPLVTGAGAAEKTDFILEVKPILESTCLRCHGPEKPKGDLQLMTRALALKGGENGTALVPGKPADSKLYKLTVLPPGHEEIMPPKKDPLSKAQTEVLRTWIEQGADWPENVSLKQRQRIDFEKHIQPILEFNCVACHREGHGKGGLRLETRDLAMKGGESGPGLVPHQPKASRIYTVTTLPPTDDALMPPKAKGGPLPLESIELLSSWIEQGAIWPEGLSLTPKKAEEAAGDELAGVTAIYNKIMAHQKIKSEAGMKAYTNTIPGTTVEYVMMAIPSGEFQMGSPEKEAGHRPDESPRHAMKVAPFWMGRCEVTWNEYELFMYPDQEKAVTVDKSNPYLDKVSDAVSRPTKPYVEMSFGMGKDGFPAISMTQHAANKYCQWLSAKTGEYYRLPTEAEWEYAARAGSTTTYFWGDDPAPIGQYAWYAKNSDFKYQKVGRKSPNPWGLQDIYGNVVEWCLDQYDPEAYKKYEANPVPDYWVRSTKPYPHVARGGHWDDDELTMLRSSVRRASDKSWKQQDPQLPKSIWYLTDAQFLGFRLVRPLTVPPPDELLKMWNNGVEHE